MYFYKEIDIEIYLRNFIYSKILKFLDKTSCANCKSKDNLRIHHNKELEFSTIFYRSLEDLNIEYKELYCDYSKKELKSLETMMLGYHLYGKFTILCEKCHIEFHKREALEDSKIKYKGMLKKYKWQLEYYRNLFPNSSLDEFLNNFNKLYLDSIINDFIDIQIFYDKKNELKNILSNDIIIEHANKLIRQKFDEDINIRGMGITSINNILQAYDMGCRIMSSKQCRNSTNRGRWYWIISKIDENITI